jgi:RpiR family carbohydrate utilization transcriptional regulator
VSEATSPPDERNLLELIASRFPYLTGALRQVAEFILQSPQTAHTMTITELAKECGVAESTVSRFVREMGVGSYQSLKLGVAEAVFSQRTAGVDPDQEFVYQGISRSDSPSTIVTKIQRTSQQALRETALGLDETALEKAVDLIDAANILVFSCIGASSIAAEDGVMRFTRAGKKCALYRDQTVQAMMATIATPTDLVIGISDSGTSTSVVDSLRLAREHGAMTLAITSDDTAPLVKHADVVLFTSRTHKEGGLYGEAVTAKWGQILVMDVLYAAFAARHFDETLTHLADTYSTAIETSRTKKK